VLRLFSAQASGARFMQALAAALPAG
jgi:hypothetical protein